MARWPGGELSEQFVTLALQCVNRNGAVSGSKSNIPLFPPCAYSRNFVSRSCCSLLGETISSAKIRWAAFSLAHAILMLVKPNHRIRLTIFALPKTDWMSREKQFASFVCGEPGLREINEPFSDPLMCQRGRRQNDQTPIRSSIGRLNACEKTR